jgi:hypothetical protein
MCWQQQSSPNNSGESNATALHAARVSIFSFGRQFIPMSIDSTTAFAQPLQRLASEIPISEIFETIPRPKIPSLFSNAVQEQIKPTRAMVETIPMQNVTTDTVSVASELAKSGSPPGYPQVADFMGDHPTLAMVRRFRGLNARNLLYLQAELVLIENKLLEQEKIDAKNDATKQYARDYQWIIPPAGGEGSEQWRLIKEMKDKLKEYSEQSSLWRLELS